MAELTKVEKKEQAANTIKALVVEINKQIESSNNEGLFITIKFTQNDKTGSKNAYLNVTVHETVSY